MGTAPLHRNCTGLLAESNWPRHDLRCAKRLQVYSNSRNGRQSPCFWRKVSQSVPASDSLRTGQREGEYERSILNQSTPRHVSVRREQSALWNHTYLMSGYMWMDVCGCGHADGVSIYLSIDLRSCSYCIEGRMEEDFTSNLSYYYYQRLHRYLKILERGPSVICLSVCSPWHIRRYIYAHLLPTRPTYGPVPFRPVLPSTVNVSTGSFSSPLPRVINRLVSPAGGQSVRRLQWSHFG